MNCRRLLLAAILALCLGSLLVWVPANAAAPAQAPIRPAQDAVTASPAPGTGAALGYGPAQQQSGAVAAVRSMPKYMTAPDLALQVVVTTTGAPLAEGLLFASPFWNFAPPRSRYTLIFDDNAELVYYQEHADIIHDFKLLPNGLLSYYDSGRAAFPLLDNQYQEVGVFRAGNGYKTDAHDLILLPNGHALLMIYDDRPYDLSPYGGYVTATVTSLIIQEVDQAQNVYFEWDSLDHIPVTDTSEPLTTANVDYAHGNAIDVALDGNILISGRHLNEITKVDRATGQIIWRLGGKQNQFTFVGEAATLPGIGAFSHQHDIRQLPNGNITIFDNANDFLDAGIHGTRGVEYRLDETAMTATFVREWRMTPDVASYYMGNVQQLPNGNTLLGWGGGYLRPQSPPSVAITEYTPGGEVALTATYGYTNFVSYRAFRFPWVGIPTTPPALVAVTATQPISLYYSWNGATEVVSYTVAGGALADSLAPFAVQPKTGFEEVTGLAGAPSGACFFRVTPHDGTGRGSPASHVVYLGDALCPAHHTVEPGAAATHTVTLPASSGPATVTLSVQTGAVTTTTVFALAASQELTPALPWGSFLASLRFQLGAYDPAYLEGAAAPLRVGPLPLTIDTSSLPGPEIARLRLVRWDPVRGMWSSEGIEVVADNGAGRQFSVLAPGAGAYLLVAEDVNAPSEWLLLPFISNTDG